MSNVIQFKRPAYLRNYSKYMEMGYDELLIVFSDQFEKDFSWKDTSVDKLKALFDACAKRAKTDYLPMFIADKRDELNLL